MKLSLTWKDVISQTIKFVQPSNIFEKRTDKI